MKPVVVIAGRSGSGKTTLIEKLVSNFKAGNYRVAVIKHTHRDFNIDHKAKDSYRFKEAGAVSTVITSDSKIAFISDLMETPDLYEIINKYIPGDIDIILVEGFKNTEAPMIEVVGDAPESALYKTGNYRISAIVSDNDIGMETELPFFKRDDVESLSLFIEDKFIKKR